MVSSDEMVFTDAYVRGIAKLTNVADTDHHTKIPMSGSFRT